MDLEVKVFGDFIFGMDVEMLDMLYVCVIWLEYVGVIFKSVDIFKVESMFGVVKIV